MQQYLTSPEYKLLLSCHFVDAKAQQISLRSSVLKKKIDEEIFKTLVIRHRIAPIVYLNLKDDPVISKELRDWLKYMTEQNQVSSLKSLQMMLNIQRQLNNLNARGIFLKGVSLAEMYYGDSALRQSIDIDLLVDEHAIVELSQCLISLGYTSKLDLDKMNRHQLRYIQKIDYHHALITSKPELSREIELHWKLRGSIGALTLNPFADSTELINWQSGGHELNVLNHVDQFLYLCAHGTEHAWFRLKWLFDLPQIIEKVDFNWESVRVRAIDLQCLEDLEISFLVLKKLLNINIPSPIAERITPQKYQRQLKYIFNAIASENGFNETDYNRIRHFLFLWSLSKKRFNLALFLKYFTGPGDWKFLPLPESLFFLYFPLRPFLWISRRVSSALKFLFLK